MPTSIAVIILAAGSSSRMGMGRHKLLLPLGKQPVVAHVVDAALASQARPIVVVVGHQAEQVRAAVAKSPTITIVENPDYLQGMSTSLRAGIQALVSSSTPVDGALIVLGDQPLMTAQIFDMLIAAKKETGKRIVIALYGGKRGQPTLFDASLFPELLEMTGDEGGRKVIERYRQEIAVVEPGDEMASYDVDTWEAYQQVIALWQRPQVAREDDVHE